MLFNLFFIVITLTNACQLECPMNWDPVCGTDGKTYGNLCQLQSLSCQHGINVDVASNGECNQQQGLSLEEQVADLVAKQLLEIKSKITVLESIPDGDIDLHESVGPSPYDRGGTTYIRWGRTVCPSDSELVYEGYAGGTHYNDVGGGVNYLCLPEDPDWGTYNDVWDSAKRGVIHGAEYQSVDSFPFSKANLPPDTELRDHEAPCAVCYTINRPSSLMIPAKRNCPSDWTREYYGYLVSGRYDEKLHDYACVDNAPEILTGKPGNEDGATLYPVDSNCAKSLPCPPYVHGREVTCVVCTR